MTVLLLRIKMKLALMRRRRERTVRSAASKRGSATAIHNAYARDRLRKEMGL
jgi:hypothetical protein